MSADTVTICHAAGQDGTTTYVRIVTSANATAGHFDNSGTPKAGHEDDILLVGEQQCPAPTTVTTVPVTTTTPQTTTTVGEVINEQPTTTTTPTRGEPQPVEPCYPQSYDPGAPCLPTDPCIVTNSDTGEGSTLWQVMPCQVMTDQPVDPGFGRDPGGVLPATGIDPLAGLIVGLSVIAAGLTCWLAARPSLRHRQEVDQ